MTARALTGFMVTVLLLGCGSETTSEELPPDRAKQAIEAGEAVSQAASTCAPLDRPMTHYNPEGKPMAFGFDYPEGWTVREQFYSAGASNIDIVTSLEPDSRSSDFVLRFNHNVTQPTAGITAVAESWRGSSRIESVDEVDLGGRSLFIGRINIGGTISYQGLFPDTGMADTGWSVSASAVQFPGECERQAHAAIVRILRSMTPNPDMGEPLGPQP